MKTSVYSIILLVLITSCSTVKNLPEPYELPFTTKGSIIKIWPHSSKRITGELIAISDQYVYILSDSDFKCHEVNRFEVSKFEVFLAKSPRYGWTMLIGSMWSITHGLVAVGTLPLNLLVTGIVTGTARGQYTINDLSNSLEDIKKYSRFPQGIPPQISYTDIR